MHFVVLVEDQSGKKALDILIPKIIGEKHTFKVTEYQGIGHIPKNMTSGVSVKNHQLLNDLPRMLRAYGRTFAGYSNYPAAVIVVCDLDDKCLKVFRQELFRVLNACNPRPETRFCIAIEEGEAWLLGDIPAVKTAYPNARDNVLNGYTNDAICGTWELLADAIFQGGATELKKRGAVGREKSIWATRIAPNMDVKNNNSPSFRYFRQKIQELMGYSGSKK